MRHLPLRSRPRAQTKKKKKRRRPKKRRWRASLPPLLATPPPAPLPVPDDAKLARLIAMDFPLLATLLALQKHDNDLEDVINHLINEPAGSRPHPSGS